MNRSGLTRNEPSLCAIVLSALVLASCGGGDNSPPRPNEPPQVGVEFPCEGCRAFGGAISVTGTASPGPDGASGDAIDRITVDAGGQFVEAIVQTDGRWIARDVPLPGDSTTFSLSATVTDLNGGSDSVALDLEYEPTLASALLVLDPVRANRGYLFELGNGGERLFSVDLTTNLFTLIREFDGLFQVAAVDIDASGSRMFILEYTGGIRAIDLATGETSTVSDASTGTGPALSFAFYMAFDADDNRFIVYDDDQHALFAVDATTGNRVIVSDNIGPGPGELVTAVSGLALDSVNDTAYIIDSSTEVSAIDLGSGNRTALAGSGDIFARPREMAFDPARDTLAIVDVEDHVVRVDLATGVATIISDGADYPGLELGRFPPRVTYDPLGDRYVISDANVDVFLDDTDRLIAVDPDTGARSLLIDNHLGTGPAAYGPGHLALDAAGQQLYLAAQLSASIVRVDLATGERHLIADSATGTGEPIAVPGDIALDLSGNRAFVLDLMNHTLVAVALDSGNRTILASSLIGTGPMLAAPISLDADLANERVYILDHGIPAVVAVDLASGDRTIVSDSSNSGPELVEFYGALLDAENNRLIIAENGFGATRQCKLVAVDLATGDRMTLVSNDIGGTEPLIDIPQAVYWVDEPDSVVVAAFDRFYLVDLNTGDRRVIADWDIGNGANPFGSRDVAYDPTKRVFYSWDSNYEALFQYELATGDRVAVTH
jgi:DNA-binding beta-propeller fold protein YncE